MISKVFCRYLTNQYRFEYDQVTPCCWISKKGNLHDKYQFQNYISWLHSIDSWVPECDWCKQQEEKGLWSPRQRALDSPEHFGFSSADKKGSIKAVEFQMDLECNAACLICGPQNSTTWKKYENTSKIDINIDNDNKNNVINRLNLIKKYTDFSSVNKLTFLGGEPLRTNTHTEILCTVDKVRDLKNVVVTYTTNGSAIPDDEVINLWKKIKTLRLSVSIDGIEDHFNYLRWPLKWHQITDNLRYLLDLNLSNLQLYFSYAVTPFNIYYHERYVEWAEKFFKGKSVNIERLFGLPFETTGIINMSCVPPTLAMEILKKYKNTTSAYLRKNGVDSKIPNLINQFDRKKYTAFMNYIRTHDQKRRLNWREIFPEIQHHFTEKLMLN